MVELRLISGLGILLLLGACATTNRPCSEGGNVTWDPKIKGDKYCHQRVDERGKVYNHGEFIQRNMKGKVILKGYFSEGERHGYWIQYDDTGKKIRERYYEKGVETSYRPGRSPEELRRQNLKRKGV